MHVLTEKEIKRRIRRYPFAYIAFWQMMVFVLLICLVWVNEQCDLPMLFFGVAQDPNIFRGWLLTAGVLMTAIIMVGNAYLQQKRMIQGLLVVCSYCGKIKIAQDAWESMQDYLVKSSDVAFSHGICPECYNKVMKSSGNSQGGNTQW